MSNEFPINQSNMYSQQYPYQRAAAPASYPYPLAPQIPQMPQNYIKGRPVVSIEEARASQIDFDGSVYVFTDIGNNKIYTKQINPLTGTATLNVFVLSKEDAAVAPPEYVTRSELNQIITELKNSFIQTPATATQAPPPKQQVIANF